MDKRVTMNLVLWTGHPNRTGTRRGQDKQRDSDWTKTKENKKRIMDKKTNILFLDDMEYRHSEFRKIAELDESIALYRVYSAVAATNLLTEDFVFDQVFLDHDLSEEDIMLEVGEKGKVPTGMTVVDHILSMKNPPREVIVHSCNGPAAIEMFSRLNSHSIKISVKKIAFPMLLQLMKG